MTAEETIIAYGELLSKAVAIVRAGEYGGYSSPAASMGDSPVVAVVEGQAELSWTEDYGDGGSSRHEALFPLHLLDSSDADLEVHFRQLKEAREREEGERRSQQAGRDEARDRRRYEELKARFGP